MPAEASDVATGPHAVSGVLVSAGYVGQGSLLRCPSSYTRWSSPHAALIAEAAVFEASRQEIRGLLPLDGSIPVSTGQALQRLVAFMPRFGFR